MLLAHGFIPPPAESSSWPLYFLLAFAGALMIGGICLAVGTFTRPRHPR